MPKAITPVLDRLVRHCVPEPNTGCLLWFGATICGYAGMRGAGGGKARMERASRLMWREAKGCDPGELCVLHHCDEPLCVNPDHLFLGTRTDNVEDKVRKGRQRNGVSLGESNPACVVSEQQARDIIALYESGTTAREAGRLMGVNENTAKHIAYGHHWKHLPRTGRAR